MSERYGQSNLREKYIDVKTKCRADWSSTAANKAIRGLVLFCLDFLNSECTQVDLVSRVPGKQYIGFFRTEIPRVISRATNRKLFTNDRSYIAENWDRWLRGRLPPDELARLSYTVAIAPCLAMELFDRQNKKGPATYFECLIGNIFARVLNVNPERKASFEIAGQRVRMTMDFLFHASNDVRIHLPVKMSTRERVVQAWSHQRMLNSSYASSAYRGILVLFSETKLDSRSHEVVEICVPDQWLAYQVLLAKMERIYYFDMPARYEALTKAYGDIIAVKNFENFFAEKDSLVRP